MRLTVAIRAFFAALFHATMAERIAIALQPEDDSSASARIPAPARPQPPAAPQRPVRSDAVSLLATLQREARFVDLVQENLDQYTDEQVGAAARDVLRDCRSAIDRLFQLQPVVDQQEGQPVNLPAGFDPGRFRLTGNVAGQPPFSGSLVHHGWQATRCEMPRWSGSDEAADVVAPAEVQLP
jgi:hypothetical protein